MPDTDEYRLALLMIVSAAKVLAGHDIPQMLRAIEHADAVGPILNPTLWMQQQRAMTEDRTLFEAALPLWHLGKRLEAKEEPAHA